jgi:hypothetical protein
MLFHDEFQRQFCVFLVDVHVSLNNLGKRIGGKRIGGKRIGKKNGGKKS